MSPHLSVYKWSIPMSISGAYRVTSVFPLSAVVLLTPVIYEAQLLTSGNWDPAQSIVAWSAETRANYDLSHLSLMLKKKHFWCLHWCFIVSTVADIFDGINGLLVLGTWKMFTRVEMLFWRLPWL